MFDRFNIEGMMKKTKKLKKPSWWHHPLIAYPFLIFVVCFGLFSLYWVGYFCYEIIKLIGGIYFL